MRKNKKIVLVLILLFPTILSLGSFITIAKATSDIPEEDPKNDWHWGVNVGDLLSLSTMREI